MVIKILSPKMSDQRQIDIIHQIIKYGVVGILNTLVTLIIIFILTKVFHVYYIWANIAGYATGVIHSFIWNKIWVFKSNAYFWGELGSFWVTIGVCYLLQLALVILLKEHYGVNPDYVTVVGMIVYSACNFLGNRLFVFRKGHGYDR